MGQGDHPAFVRQLWPAPRARCLRAQVVGCPGCVPVMDMSLSISEVRYLSTVPGPAGGGGFG